MGGELDGGWLPILGSGIFFLKTRFSVSVFHLNTRKIKLLACAKREEKKERKQSCNVSAPELGVAYPRPEIQMGNAKKI